MAEKGFIEAHDFDGCDLCLKLERIPSLVVRELEKLKKSRVDTDGRDDPN